MFDSVLKKVLGTKHQREVKRMQPMVTAISALEGDIKKLSDAQLRGKTAEFRQQLDNGASLDDLLVPAYAVAREAGKRVLGMRHYDVQLVGGIVLHQGKIAEMKTGEGKTLVATLPCYLNGLEGKGVHVVTVNDYLASRDAEWMGKLYGFLGPQHGRRRPGQSNRVKKRAYDCDITYGQNNEFGFDYMRDNMKFSIYDYVQRDLNYAIVDEVDSISDRRGTYAAHHQRPGETASDKYETINESSRAAQGRALRPRREEPKRHPDRGRHGARAGAARRSRPARRRRQPLRPRQPRDAAHPAAVPARPRPLPPGPALHGLRRRQGDDHRRVHRPRAARPALVGRPSPGGRGQRARLDPEREPHPRDHLVPEPVPALQQALRHDRYGRHRGDRVPQHLRARRRRHPDQQADRALDEEDLIYKTEREKFRALCAEIEESHKRGQPVLVGTTSVEKSDAVAHFLNRAACRTTCSTPSSTSERRTSSRRRARRAPSPWPPTWPVEAPTSCSAATRRCSPNRGARERSEDVLSDPERREAAIAKATEHLIAKCKEDAQRVKDAGGLRIIGTERHESRRIDNQLRGRSGRQGDPGASRFFLSLEDDLMRIFAGERVQAMMDRLGMEEDIPIEHRWVTRAVENAQKKVEERNFDIRKHSARVRRRDEPAAQEHVRAAQAGSARRVPKRSHRRRAQGRRRARAVRRRRSTTSCSRA